MENILLQRFLSIDYLKSGTSVQKKAYHILRDNKVLERLDKYTPILAGTIPLDIDVEDSDLDIICYFPNPQAQEKEIKEMFSTATEFTSRISRLGDKECLIANFRIAGVRVEIFGQNLPVDQQMAVMHMLIEYKILQNYGADFKSQVRNLKIQGMKTEPAFAHLLKIEGEPYEGLLTYSI